MYALVEQPSVAAAVDEARERWPRAADAWDAVTWVLARDPGVGRALTDSGKSRSFTLEGARSIGLPTVTLVYEIGSGIITVHDVRFTEAKYGQAGHA
jgi:hypothetical protein